jgi:hypothetical protein
MRTSMTRRRSTSSSASKCSVAFCNRTPGALARCSPATGPLLTTVTTLTNDPVAGLRADPVASG